jgi:alkaline phosphatase D
VAYARWSPPDYGARTMLGDPDPLTRRSFVTAAALAGGGVVLGGTPAALAAKRKPRRKPREPFVTAGAFSLGVAAGLPSEREITLWTRVDDVDRNSRIRLEVARDPDFAKTVLVRDVRVPVVRDFTARARVTGLAPGEQYFYRFVTREKDSPVGRFRTARPADSTEPVRIGVFSCMDYRAGYYTGHRALAGEEDLDLVVCLGDYVYEQIFYPGPADREDKTGGNGDGYVLSLAEYRDKYRLYKADPDLQALHAAHPFVAIWDDHEVEDNYAGDRIDAATTDTRPRVLAERRRQGYLAFYEYMPRLRTKPVDTKIYGSIPLGANAEVFLLDERQYRDPQPCGDQLAVPCTETEAPRTFLGAQQKAWLKGAVTASKARWKVVANQLMIMSLDSAPGQTLNVDAWDGYAAERREVLEHFLANGVTDLTFLTGDIHTFFAGDVYTTGRQLTGKPVGTEFVAGSMTSLGLENTFPAASLDAIRTGLPATNPHIKFAELERRGYAIAEATPTEFRVEYKGPASTTVRGSAVSTIAKFRVAAGTPQVQRA